jgi:hypothetical protein
MLYTHLSYDGAVSGKMDDVRFELRTVYEYICVVK